MCQSHQLAFQKRENTNDQETYERCATLLVIKNMHIKTKLYIILFPLYWQKLRSITKFNFSDDEEQ